MSGDFLQGAHDRREGANIITDSIVPLFFRPFSPDRWLGGVPPASSNAVPGVWANIMTFSGGPRSCIGFKFAILESVLVLARGCYSFSHIRLLVFIARMKALLFYLVKSFSFEPAVDPSEIMRNELCVLPPLFPSLFSLYLMPPTSGLCLGPSYGQRRRREPSYQSLYDQ